MRSSQWNRYGKAPAQLTLNQKIFNVLMAFVLVFTLIPITSLTYTDEANAEPTVQQLSDEAAGNESSSNDSSSQNGNSGQSNTGTSEGSQNGADSSEVQEGGSDNSDSTNTGSNNQSSQQGDSNQNANQTNNNQGSNNGSSNTTPSGNEGDQSGTSTPVETEGSDEADEQQRDPMAWQSNLDACEVSAELAIDANEIDELENNQLPSNIPATLKLQFELTPGKDFLLVDDWIELSLPSFLSSENAQFDVFRLNEDGTETTEKIADAKIENGTLKITFIEAAATEDEQAVVRGFVDVPVSMASSMLGEEESEQSWVVQTAQDGTERVIKLGLPTYNAVLDAWNSIHNPLGMLGSTLGLSNGEVTAQNTGERDGVTGSTTYSLSGYTGADQMIITWCDNNYGDRPEIEEWAPNFIPQFTLNGGETWINLLDSNGNLTDDARKALRIEGADTPAWVKSPTVIQTSVGDWTVSFSGMPTQLNTTTREPSLDTDGNQIYNPDGTPAYTESTDPTSIQWQLVDENSCPAGYIYGEKDGGSNGDHRYLMKTQEFTFTITGKLGGSTLQDVFASKNGSGFGGDHAGDFRFSALIDNQPVVDDDGAVRSTTLAAMENDESGFDIAFSEDGNTATITATLPQYTTDGEPIVYYVYFEDQHQGQTDHDYYQPAYDNTNSPSHGSSTSALYDGGSMTLRPIGNVSYAATKKWLDGGNKEDRPETTFTLWRYSTKGNVATAAQVQLNEVDQGTGTAGESQGASVQYASITVPAGSDETVDLHKLLQEKYGDAIDNLPKYDPDGYPYIYALREEGAPAGYELVYGTVDENGNVEDVAPNYTDINGEKQTLGMPNRDSDPFIYNGGVATNRLTGTVEVEGTKTWEIAAFQDSLQDVVVTFQAQSRLAGTNNEWENVTGENSTVELTDWNAETLTKTFNETFRQYDSQGRELEYRWIESNVTLDDQETNFTSNENGDGGGTFMLTLQNTEGEDEVLNFTSTVDPETGVIVNSFDNTTQENVQKLWEQPNGDYLPVKPEQPAEDAEGLTRYPDSVDLDGKATVELFQDGKKIGEFTMDGTVDADAQSITGLEGATWQETSSYYIEFEGLPKYDEGGMRHSYLVLETPKAGWHVDRTYNATDHLTTITNTIGDGEGSEIRIIKDWNDGDDAEHRLTAVVNLVAVNEMTAKENIDPATGALYHYAPGETVIENIKLSAANSWFAEVDVPIGDLTYTDFRVVEVALIDEETGVTYPVVADSEAASTEYANISIDQEWINTGWNYESTQNTSRVATTDHVYETTAGANDGPQYNDEMSAVVAGNRRLGLLDLTVTKVWKDGAVHPDRPEAQLEVVCTEYSDAFSVDDSGNVWVQISHNKLPVMNGEGDDGTTEDGTSKPARQLNTNKDPVAVENGTLVVTVKTDAEENQSTFHIYGLPKYDDSGNVVHYDVNETINNPGEYVSSKDVEDYTVGVQHFHDTQTITFENTRVATRDVTFYKQWNDHYVNDELGQRPDIYLTLYRTTVTVDSDNQPQYSAPVAVDGYVHYLWHATNETSDPQYAQSCTIEGLPAYDADGNEYIYYASESMSADGASLDYAPVKFDVDGIEGDDFIVNADGYEPEAKYVKVDQTVSEDDPTVNGTGYAIHEEGTFVNDLTNNVVANGTKLWKNVPGNVAQEDLPEITVYLQQKLASDDDWPSLKFEVTEDGTWKFAENTTAIAWTSNLTQTTTNQYSYQLRYTGDNTNIDPTNPQPSEGQELLPRYDENGNLYEYRAIEVVWGLMDQPGGFTEKWVEDMDFSELRDSTNDAMGVYVISHGETGSYLINNTYNSAKGQLTVKKLFDGRDDGDAYPDVTFDVYRYYVNEDGTASQANRVATHTITGDQLATATSEDANLKVTNNNDGNNSAEYTFTDLDIYAPDGSYWQYYVVESTISGYETKVGVGNLDANSNELDKGVERDGLTTGISSPDLCEVAIESEPAVGEGETATSTTYVSETVLSGDTTPDVTFLNTYVPGSISISGTKTWDDHSNLLGLRPTVDQFMDALTFKQIGNGSSEAIDLTKQLQSEEPEEDFYYTIQTSAENSDVYTIIISNLERWAPDGTAWRYQISENLDSMAFGEGLDHHANEYYEAVGSTTQTVIASAGATFAFENELKGSVTVHKNWENDGDDAYGLRPSTVTVRLQARVTYDGQNPGEWTDACQLLKDTGYETELEKILQNLGQSEEQFFERELYDGNGWNGSWTGLPMAGIGKATEHEGEFFTIEYRAVEIAIGDQEVTPQPTESVTAENEGKIYGSNVSSYVPSQEDSGDAENGFHSVVTNTLDDTSISVTKNWSDDSDKWGIRPGTDTWSVTYLLQRTTQDGNWDWVLEYSDEDNPAPVKGPLDNRIVSQTISGNSSESNKSATWKYLPRTDVNGNVYAYRVVEQVPGGYDVVDGYPLVNSENNPITATDDNGVTWRYYVVNETEGAGDVASAQTFNNKLRMVGLTGTKEWNDYGTGIADDYTVEDMPQMKLYRSVEGGQAQEVTYLNADDGQPEWTKDEDSGNWTFTYSDLPAADEQDRPYTYWAEEVDVTTDGFYPLYGTGDGQGASSHDASGTKIEQEASATQSGQQTNETITNVATRFTLDKASEDDSITLNNIQLAVFGPSDSSTADKVYAVWYRNNDGNVSSWVNIDGVDYSSIKSAESDVIDTSKLADAGFSEMSGNNAGAIIGLNAGSYRVVETGDAPENHATAVDVPVTINANGSITANGKTVNATAPNVDTAVDVTVEDPLFRGHVTLTKTANDQTTDPEGAASGLVGAVFSLYHDNGEKGVSEDDSLVASGLTTTGSEGTWTSIGSNDPIVTMSDIYDATYRKILADGLIPGDYYFIETSAPSNVYDTGDWSSTPIEFTIEHEDNYHAYAESPETVATASDTNALFRAKVTLTKYDAFLDEYFSGVNNGLEDVSFTLEYKEAGAENYDASKTTTVSTDSNGLLTLNIERKGDYRLTETTPTGYTGSFQATFTIENADYNQTFDLNNESDRNTLSFAPAAGNTQQVVNGEGLPNERIPGSVTLTKTDSVSQSPLNGVEFQLERLDSDGTTWKQVTNQTFVTGNTYALNDANNSVASTTPDATGTVSGKVVINNLWWGTYRFVEVGGLNGYIEGHENTTATSEQFTIDATGVASTQAGATTANVSMTNTPTQLEIRKTNTDGTTLEVEDVTFKVTPAAGSAFADGTKTELELSTNADGIATLERAQLILGNNYVIQETAAPEGYELRSDALTIHVNDGSESGKVAGTIDIVTSADGYAIDGGVTSGIRLTASDEPIQLSVKKVNADGVTLSGATFTLSGEDGTSITGITTNENGEYTITSGLKANVEYTLAETAAPDGYIFMTQPFKFSINNLGEIVAEDQSANGYAFDNTEGVVVITAKDAPSNLTISKVDAEGDTLLPGAEFTVTPVNDAQGNASRFVDGSSSKTLTTTLNSTQDKATDSIIGQLIVGDRYEIKEIQAPNGYTLIDGSVIVEVQQNGSLKIVNDPENPAPDEFVIDGSAVNVITGEVKNNPTELTIKKVDADTNNAAYGAQFSLKGNFADGATMKSLAMSSDMATISLDKALLIADGLTTYTLEETVAPDGYELIDPLTFTVATNGTITPTDPEAADSAGWTINDDGITLTAKDEPVEIQLIKNGSDGQNNLSGAVFELYEGSSATGNAIRQETTDNNGTLRLDKLVANHTYTLHEVSAPAGYEVMDDVTFSVATNGTIAFSNPTLADQAGYTVDNSQDVVQITATDRQVEISLVKSGSDNQGVLPGAVFRLYKLDGANRVQVGNDLTTDSQGVISLNKLTANTKYVLSEVTAPAGYELLGEFSFTVNSDGGIEDAQGDGYTFTEENGSVTISAVDDAISIELHKQDLGTAALSGAEFELSGKFVDDATHETKELTIKLAMNDSSTLTLDGIKHEGATYSLIANTEYTITETKAPVGYELNESFTFKVNENGTVSSDSTRTDNGAGYTIDGNGVIVTGHDEPVEIELAKQNGNNQALTGAEFIVKPVEGSTFVNTSLNESGIPVTAGDTNALDAQLVADNAYTISETKAPAGYELITGNFTFKVNTDGSITESVEDGVQNSDDFQIGGEGNVTITATDEPISIELIKNDLDDNVLDGAVFNLTGVFANEDGTAGQQTQTRTITLTNGAASINGLIASYGDEIYEYQLVETTAPDGYELMDPFSFTVNNNGTIAAAEGSATATTGQEGFMISDSGGTVALTAHDTPIEVKLVKVSGEKYLSGAVFELYEGSSATGTLVGSPVTTGDDGSVALSDLVAGETYTLHEVTAPQGYELLPDVSFTVSNEGEILLVNEVAGYSVATEGGIATITADDTPIEAKLVKVDASGNPLEGAVFTIANTEDSSDTKTFTTGNDGIATIDPAWLVAGRTYTVVEVEAPSGYELAGSATFTVGTDGTLSLVADDGTAAGSVLGAEGSGSYGVTIESGGVAVLTASDTPIAAQLIKTDLNGGTLAGATFELAPVEGTTFSDGSTEARSVQMGEAGVVALEGLVAKGSYTLRETVAPAGYELNTTEFTFTVNEDGTVSANDQDGYMAVDRGGVVSVTATDAPIEIQLTKTDLGGNALDGAKFSIEGIFASEGGTSEGAITQRTFDASADGATITGLIGGETYTITELEPPAGYKNAGSFSFTVGTDGTIAAAQGQQQAEEGTEGYSISADGLQMTVADAQIQAQLLKQSSTGESLEGATFTIEGTFAGEYANETTVQVGPSNAEGIIAIPAGVLIANNTYTLTEVTAPQGYELAGLVEFSVGTDGTISLTGTTEEGSAVAGTDGTGTYTASATEGMAVVTATDKLTELTITKTDSENALLPGAEFTATATLGEGETGPAHTVSGTTDENGSLVLTGLIAGKQYTLTETKAPAGYELLTDELTFTVNSDGTIDAGWFPPAAFKADQDAVSVTDDKLLVTMLKQDPNGNPLAGAEFTIEGEFPDGDTSKSFTSNNEGIVFEDTQFIGSAEGTRYVVTETSAPEGFELPQGSFEMLVYEDGTLEIVGDSSLAQAAEVSETGGTAVVAVDNEPLPGTELIKTSDILSSLVAGALGLLGLTAIVTATVARRVLRRKE